MNLSDLARHFSDEAAAWALVEEIRWHGHPVCPHCGVVDHAYYLEPRQVPRVSQKGQCIRAGPTSAVDGVRATDTAASGPATEWRTRPRGCPWCNETGKSYPAWSPASQATPWSKPSAGAFFLAPC